MAVVRIKWIKHCRARSIPGTRWTLSNCQLLLSNHSHLPPQPSSLGTILLCSCAFIIFACVQGKFFRGDSWSLDLPVEMRLTLNLLQLILSIDSCCVQTFHLQSNAWKTMPSFHWKKAKRSHSFLARELDLSLKRQVLSYQNHRMVPINSAGSFANNLRKIIP